MRVDGTLNSTKIQFDNKGLNTNKTVFNDFVRQNSNYPTIPLNVSKACISPQLYPEKVLETFKLPNTGVGKVYQLRNGHKVIVVPKKGSTVINTYLGGGSFNEKSDKREVAHLLEHLLAENGYKNNAGELINIRKKLDIKSNASTSGTHKNYYTMAPIFNNNELDRLIKVQFDTLFKPDFKDQDIEKEKKIIVEEHLKSNLKKQKQIKLMKLH